MNIKFLPIVVTILIAAFALTSCLGNDKEEVTYSYESAITSFSLGTLKVKKTVTTAKGDSSYIEKVDGSKYLFQIDQEKRLIENMDSLPLGTDISKIIANINANSNIILYKPINKDGTTRNDTLWVATDSIDFSYNGSLQFKAVSASGFFGKPYQVKINVHKQNPDQMVWKTFGNKGITDFVPERLIAGGDYLFAFGVKNNAPTIYRMSMKDGVPTEWMKIANCPTDINPASAVLWKEFFQLTAPGKIYMFDGNEFFPKEITGISQLLAVDSNDELYAIKDGKSGKLDIFNEYTWKEDSEQSGISGMRFTTAATPVSYNSTLSRIILMYEQEDGTQAAIYQRLSNETRWTKYTYSKDEYACPNYKGLTILSYDQKLFALGGANTTTFGQLRESKDYGLTWKVADKQLQFPTEFSNHYVDSKAAFAACVDGNNFIWVLWGDGSLSRGRINRLGYAVN